jgi:hypothetical protein
MSLGLIASTASVLRLVYTTKYITLSDPLYDIVLPAIWGNVEEYLGIIAACVPFLRVPFERVLSKVGLLSIHETTQRDENTYVLSPVGNGSDWASAGRVRPKDIIAPGSPHYGNGRSTEVLYSNKT